MVDFTAYSDGRFVAPTWTTACVLGRSGGCPAADKREGDGASPFGAYALRRVFFRPDRGPPPLTRLPIRALTPRDGWCDAPGDLAYNRLVAMPYLASAERLWREDEVYDLIVVLGHNDDPPVSPLGSAIFLHIWRTDRSPTEGCVALARDDLLKFLAEAAPGDRLAIAP